MSQVCNLKTTLPDLYYNRSKVTIDYLYLYSQQRIVIDAGQTVTINLDLQLNFQDQTGTYLPFDIWSPKTLIKELQFVENPIHVQITEGYYRPILQIKNVSTTKINITMGSAIAQINMDQPFKVIVSSIKNE